jgi:pimeloyl-ACP methyl ester carboxylesterase
MKTNWLLLRGLTRDQRHWGEFPDRLSKALDARVLTIDPPGFGLENKRPSPMTIAGITDDIRDRYAAQRGNDEWAVLGISLGGMVALDWCARYPGDFQRAVVINTSSSDTTSFRHRFNPAAARDLIVAAFRSPVAVERAALAASSNRSSDELDVIAKQWAQWQRERGASRVNAVRQAGAAVKFTLPEMLKVPLLVLTSRGDRLVSHHSSDEIAKRLGAQIKVHDKAGHDLPLDDPAWVCEQIARWCIEGSGTQATPRPT